MVMFFPDEVKSMMVKGKTTFGDQVYSRITKHINDEYGEFDREMMRIARSVSGKDSLSEETLSDMENLSTMFDNVFSSFRRTVKRIKKAK